MKSRAYYPYYYIDVNDNREEFESSHLGFWDHPSAQFYFWKKRLRFSLKRATQILSPTSAASTELFAYPVGVGSAIPANVSALPDLGYLSPPAQVNLGISVGWNFIDASAAIINGVNLLLEEDDYRHTQNKIKGVLSIISGVQGLALSYNPTLEVALGLGAGGVAGPAFAFMTFCDLINASIDFYQASREVDRETWFEERVQEINFLDKRIEELNNEIKVNFKQSIAAGQEDLKKEIEDKIKKLTERRDILKNQFAARAKVYCFEKLDSEGQIVDDELLDKRLDKVESFTNKYLRDKAGQPLLKDNTIESTLEALCYQQTPTVLTQGDIDTDREIQKRLTKDYEKKKIYLVMKAISFAAMMLFAAAPFTGPAAPALIIPAMVMSSFVTTYYLYEHRDKFKYVGKNLKNKVNELKHLFAAKKFSI